MMNKLFSCTYEQEKLIIHKNYELPLVRITLWIDGIRIMDLSDCPQIVLNRREFDAGIHKLNIHSYFVNGPEFIQTIDQYEFYGLDTLENLRINEREFRAGDILVACDNTFGIPHGYMGHVALTLDAEALIEAVAFFPSIKKDNIQQFLKQHPNHAQYRPINEENGKIASNWAYEYYRIHQENIKKGSVVPMFSILAPVPLSDPWGSVYCSKLVWLSYYYGASIEFEHNKGIFSPAALDKCLSKDPNFHQVYKHPEFKFKTDFKKAMDQYFQSQ